MLFHMHGLEAQGMHWGLSLTHPLVHRRTAGSKPLVSQLGHVTS